MKLIKPEPVKTVTIEMEVEELQTINKILGETSFRDSIDMHISKTLDVGIEKDISFILLQISK